MASNKVSYDLWCAWDTIQNTAVRLTATKVNTFIPSQRRICKIRQKRWPIADAFALANFAD